MGNKENKYVKEDSDKFFDETNQEESVATDKPVANALDVSIGDDKFFDDYEKNLDKMSQSDFTDRFKLANENPEHYYAAVTEDRIVAKLHDGYAYLPVKADDSNAVRPIFGQVVDGHWKVNELTLLYTRKVIHDRKEKARRFNANRSLEQRKRALNPDSIEAPKP